MHVNCKDTSINGNYNLLKCFLETTFKSINKFFLLCSEETSLAKIKLYANGFLEDVQYYLCKLEAYFEKTKNFDDKSRHTLKSPFKSFITLSEALYSVSNITKAEEIIAIFKSGIEEKIDEINNSLMKI